MTNLDAAWKLLTGALLDAARETARDAAREELRRERAEAGGEEWITQVEAAARADVTPQTIREWLAAGHLGERGQRGRVNAETLRQFLAGRSAPCEEAAGNDSMTLEARQLAASVLRKIGG